MKLQGFTILELLTAMVITALLVLMAFSAYRLIQQQFFLFQKTNDSVIEWQNTYVCLYNDFEKAALVRRNFNVLVCQYDNFSVSYQFSNNYILKYNTHRIAVDTFFVSGKISDAFFNKTSVLDGLVNKIDLKIRLDNEVLPVAFLKNYSAADLINNRNK